MSRQILLPISCLFILCAGCSGGPSTMKFRSQRPSIDEAFKKISLAVTVDGYQLSSAEPTKYRLETGWRELKEKEKSEADRVAAVNQGPVEARLALRMDRRGALYDVFITLTLRYGGEAGREITPGVRHPLWEKWQNLLSSLLEREAKEED